MTTPPVFRTVEAAIEAAIAQFAGNLNCNLFVDILRDKLARVHPEPVLTPELLERNIARREAEGAVFATQKDLEHIFPSKVTDRGLLQRFLTAFDAAAKEKYDEMAWDTFCKAAPTAAEIRDHLNALVDPTEPTEAEKLLEELSESLRLHFQMFANSKPGMYEVRLEAADRVDKAQAAAQEFIAKRAAERSP